MSQIHHVLTSKEPIEFMFKAKGIYISIIYQCCLSYSTINDNSLVNLSKVTKRDMNKFVSSAK